MYNPEDVEIIQKKLQALMLRVGERVLSRVAVLASNNMIVPGGKGLPVNPSRVTTRTARLLRSIVGARGQEWESSESVKKVSVGLTRVKIVVGTDVPYAHVHERMPPFTNIMTAKMRKFFWFKFMQTKEAMWRAMALSKGITHKGPRPFIAPAVQAVESDIPMIYAESFAEIF